MKLLFNSSTFVNSIDLNSTFFNLPLPASEKMNFLVILYLEVFYMTLFIFFVVSLVLLETVIVYSSSQSNQEGSLSFHVYPSHFTPDEEHFIDIFAICIPTLIVLQIIVPTLGYLYNEELFYSDRDVFFYVNVIVSQWFLSLILVLILPILIYFFYHVSIFYYKLKKIYLKWFKNENNWDDYSYGNDKLDLLLTNLDSNTENNKNIMNSCKKSIKTFLLQRYYMKNRAHISNRCYSTIPNNNSNNNINNNCLEENSNSFYIVEKTVNCNKNITIESENESEILNRGNKTIQFDKTIITDQDILNISTKKKFFNYLFVQIILFLIYLPFFIIKFMFHFILFYIIKLLSYIYIYFINIPIIYINTKLLNSNSNDIIYYELLTLKELHFLKKLLIIFWLIIIELPLIILLIIIIILLNLLCLVSCFIFSIFNSPIHYLNDLKPSVPFNKYFFPFLLVVTFFISVNLFFTFLVIGYHYNIFIYVLLFTIISIFNYKNKPIKVTLNWSIWNFILLISDIFRYRLTTSFTNLNEKFEDLDLMLTDCIFIYKITYFFEKLKRFIGWDPIDIEQQRLEEWSKQLDVTKITFSEFKSVKDLNLNLYENNQLNSNCNSNQINKNTKRNYVKKLIPVYNQVGKKVELFNQTKNFFKYLDSKNQTKDQDSIIKGVNTFVTNDSIILNSNFLDFETEFVNSKIQSLNKFSINLKTNKFYTVATHTDGSESEYVGELNINVFNFVNKNDSVYFFKDTQVLKLTLDFINKKIPNYTIIKSVSHFSDIEVGYINGKSFFANCLDSFDRKMQGHPGVTIPYTCIDPKTNEVSLRILIMGGQSDKIPPILGDFISKSNQTISSNISKPYSKLIDKPRDISFYDYQQITVDDPNFKLSQLNQKHGHILYRYLENQLVDKNIKIEVSDFLTGKKYIFLCLGDFTHYFKQNPHMINEVLTSKKHTDMQLKLLNLYCKNKDFISSTLYGIDNTYENTSITETSPQDLIVYKSIFLFCVLNFYVI